MQRYSGSAQQYTYQPPADTPTNATQPHTVPQDQKMTGLDVLVAVATNEDSARNASNPPTAP